MQQSANEAAALIRDNLAPRVLVASSASADRLVLKGVGVGGDAAAADGSVARLFAGMSRGEDASLRRHGVDRSVANFRLRYRSLQQLRVVGDERMVVETSEAVVAANVPGSYCGVPLRSQEDIAAFLDASESQCVTPWLRAFARATFGSSLAPAYHETFSHYVGVVVVASSADTAESVGQLYGVAGLAGMFPPGLEDSSIPVHTVILHDPHEVPMQQATALMSELGRPQKETHLVTINSLDELGEDQSFLAPADRDSISSFLTTFCVDVVIPYLLNRCIELNQQVESSKKSLTQSLTDWWKGGSKKTEVETTTEGLKHQMDSVVMLYRRLADSMFLLQDYEAAYERYQSCAKEVKRDQDMFFAACLEMQALCIYLLRQRDSPQEIDAALHIYVKLSPRYALRCALFGATLAAASGNWQRAGILYSDASERQTEALYAAVLQEQASLCLLRFSKPRLRRFAFRLVFAARKFVTANCSEHALRCYLTVYEIYKQSGWALIMDHIHLALARQYAVLGDIENSLLMFQRLLCHCEQSPSRQAAYLREFMQMCAKRDSVHDVLAISFPHIVVNSPRILLSDPGQRAKQTPELSIEWERLEKELLRHKTRASHRRSVSRVIRSNHPVDCAKGEPLFFVIDLRNPLQVPLQLKEIRLVLDPDVKMNAEVSELFIPPSGVGTMCFKGTPLTERETRWSAVEFRLFGEVTARVGVSLPQIRLNRTARERKGVFYERNERLSVRVCGPMPMVEAVLGDDFPKEMLSGEIRQSTLCLTNVGKTGAKNLRIKFSEPGLFFIGKRKFTNKMQDMSVAPLTDVILLESGSSVTLPLWVRGGDSGSHVCRFLLYYEPEGSGSAIRHRVVHFEAPLVVHPSLDLTCSSWPNPRDVRSYLLNVSLRNPMPKQSVQVKSVTCLSYGWDIVPIEGIACPLESPIEPNTSSISVFNLVPTRSDHHLSVAFGEDLSEDALPLIELTIRERAEDLFENQTIVVSTLSQQSYVLFEPNAVLLMVRWETTGDEQQCLSTLFDVDYLEVPQQPREKMHQPVIACLVDAPPSVSHDFQANPLCLVPVVIDICNPNTTSATFAVKLVDGDCFSWIGINELSLTLEPGQKETITASACFTTYGMHDVANCCSISPAVVSLKPCLVEISRPDGELE